ncbi:MAG: GNAT family N-acetyltransferase [Rhodothalassiaceae bacterium]
MIDQEQPEDGPGIEALLDLTFGADRQQRTAYRFRDGVAPIAGLGFVVRGGTGLLGSVRFWPILLAHDGGSRRAVLLGPLAVAPELRGNGTGTALLRHAVAAADAAGEGPIFLIGDVAYYGRAGFRPVLPARCRMPGPVEPERVLVWDADGASLTLPSEFALLPSRDGAAATSRRAG